MRSTPSLLARALEPLASGLWVLFVLTSALVGVVWAFGLGDAQLARWVPNQGLVLTLHWLLHYLDLAWIALAAISGYRCLAEREGLDTARRWALTIMGATLALAWVSARSGFPLGPIQYGQTLGAKIGAVPLGLLLFWFSVVIGAREALHRYFPKWSHVQIAIGAGVIGLLTDVNLEPIAAKLRGFWFWRSGSPTLPPIFDAPFTGSLAWGLLVGLLAFAWREKSVVASARPRSWPPIVTLAIFQAVLLAAHLGRWLRG